MASTIPDDVGADIRVQRRLRAIKLSMLPALSLIVIVVIWQAITWLLAPPAWLLPSPVRIAEVSVAWSRSLPYHTAVTLYETLVGFFASIIFGIPAAILIVYSTFLQRTIYPLLLALQSMPKVAVAPLLLIWVGHGELPKIIVVFLVCFFPILVSAVSGMQAVPESLINLVRGLSAKPLQVFVKIRLPSAMPFIFVGLKVAITLAVIGAVIGEFVGAEAGLGYLILISTQQFDTALAFAAIILLTLMSIILYFAIEYVERLVIPWAIEDSDPS
jgi:NitT/TauT family transport system permease protein